MHRMKQTAVYVDDEVRRAAAKVDQNFGVREKAAQAADGYDLPHLHNQITRPPDVELLS